MVLVAHQQLQLVLQVYLKLQVKVAQMVQAVLQQQQEPLAHLLPQELQV
jgi:hypothetical protein